MKRSLWLCLTLSAYCHATTLVFRAPHSNPQEYRSFVLSSPSHRFPADYFLAQVSATGRKRLADVFSRAQYSFVDGSLEQAAEEYKTVVALARTEQWSSVEQSIFLHSYLRLAQMENDPEATKQWLIEAVYWAPLGRLDKILFPPPLLVEFEALKKSLSRVDVSVSHLAPDYQVLVANGERFSLGRGATIAVTDGPVLVTLFSNTYKTQQLELNARELATYQPPREPWVLGTCEKSVVRYKNEAMAHHAFFSLNCSLPDSAPIMAVASPAPTPQPEMFSLQQSTATKEKSSLFQNKWFWAGVGAVVITAIALSTNQGGSSRPQPTHSEGF